MTELITSPGMADLSSASHVPTPSITDLSPIPDDPAPAEAADAASSDDDDDPDPITKSTIAANFLPRWNAPDLLDLTLGNYRRWEHRIVHVLSVCGELALYLDPDYVCLLERSECRISARR